MRGAVLFLGLLLAGCDDYPAVQKEDTIEGYEKYLAENPESIYKPQIDKRLEELYFEKAQSDGSLAAWDAYLAKFPEGKHKKEADEAREALRFEEAEKADTIEAYKAFLAEFPKAKKEHRKPAENRVAVLEYGKIELTPPEIIEVNMAEDPKGPMDGWGVKVNVKNAGDKTVEYLRLAATFYGNDGAPIEKKSQLVVAKNDPMPHPEEQEKPMPPGDTRVWIYTIAKSALPDDWGKKVDVKADALKFVGDGVAEGGAAGK